MSRSYRKPYSAITGHSSAADDKRTARRCWRRAQNHALRSFQGDWDAFLIPERYEASFNDVWGWRRDGVQRLRFLSHNDLNPYAYTRYCGRTYENLMKRHYQSLELSAAWIRDLHRK